MNYKTEIWLKAKHDADAEVMRLTATVPGGRKEKEGIRDYVLRVRSMQEAALDRWATACDELEKAQATQQEKTR